MAITAAPPGVREELRKHPMIVRRLLTADRNYPRYRAALEDELRREVADAAYRVRAGVSDIVPGAMQLDWYERMAELKRRYLIPMVAMAYELTDAEMQGKQDPDEDADAVIAGVLALGVLSRFEVDRINRWIQATTKNEVKRSATRVQTEYDRASAYWHGEAGAGLTAQQITQRTTSAFEAGANAVARSRANMMARTGTIWSFNEGAQARYREAGVTYKQWLATEDDLTCEYCMEMDGDIVGVDGEFADAGAGVASIDPTVQSRLKIPAEFGVEHPPLHPYCRCTIVPVIEEL